MNPGKGYVPSPPRLNPFIAGVHRVFAWKRKRGERRRRRSSEVVMTLTTSLSIIG